MSHDNAPATKLVATHCAACGRPLIEAESLVLGVGPICVKRYALPAEQYEARVRANELIYQIAALQKSDWLRVRTLLVELHALPRYGTLARKIQDRLQPKAQLSLKAVGQELHLYAPYNPGTLADLRAITGRRFVRGVDAKGKEVCYNAVPQSQKRALWTLLQKHYEGVALETPGGDVVLVPKYEEPKQLALSV